MLTSLAAVASRRSFSTAIGLLLLAVPAGARASSPTAVIALATAVSYEPSRATATRVIVTGRFALVKTPAVAPYQWSAGQAGYLYLSCPTGKEALCRQEWKDLEQAVAKGDCAMFGDVSSSVLPTVRATGTPPSAPDPYPINMGLLVTPFALGECPKLKAMAGGDGGLPRMDGGAARDGAVRSDGAAVKGDGGAATDQGSPARGDAAAMGREAGVSPGPGGPTAGSGGCEMSGLPVVAVNGAAFLAGAILVALTRRRRRRRAVVRR
ncbi:MAG: hypothetical protein IT371_23320 [Deltaproteobacteria bacterium]|nr:hypothetical protein [Deltaproteobacteria bacterium]